MSGAKLLTRQSTAYIEIFENISQENVVCVPHYCKLQTMKILCGSFSLMCIVHVR